MEKNYDPKTLDLMQWAIDTASEEYALAGGKVDLAGIRATMAARIVAAVRDGERDPERLKERDC